jgi:hypothetical protein
MEIKDVTTNVEGFRKLFDYIHSEDNKIKKPHPAAGYMVFYLRRVNGTFMPSTNTNFPRYNVNIAEQYSPTKEQREGLLRIIGEIAL